MTPTTELVLFSGHFSGHIFAEGLFVSKDLVRCLHTGLVDEH